jgi:hypothetical protein
MRTDPSAVAFRPTSTFEQASATVARRRATMAAEQRVGFISNELFTAFIGRRHKHEEGKWPIGTKQTTRAY